VWRAYETPISVDETLHLLAENGSESRIIAGGTDLLVELRRAARHDPVLIDITRIGKLDRVWIDDKDWIHVGPNVTHNQAAASTLLAARGCPLALACCQVGTPQVRNRGTVVGNQITASPANDTITALWALEGRLTLRSNRGERTLSFPEFFKGVRRTAIAPDEMVTDIAFPALRSYQRGVFVKLGLRRANAISVVNAAAILTLDGNRVTEARIALGSVAPTIVRAPEAEAALLRGSLNAERIGEAASLAAQAAAPISDVRAGAGYRREAVGFLVRRALMALRDGMEHKLLSNPVPMLWGSTDGHFPPLKGKALHHGNAHSDRIECLVNGRQVVAHGAGQKRVLDMLRENLDLAGTKEGCGEGECGACTIWMDWIAVLACLVPAPRAHGTIIHTIEGLAQEEMLHPLQQAFIDEGAVQCGYCTPGFLMAGASMLEEIPCPTREQVKTGLSGNLCRCTGYYKIMSAVERAAAGEELHD
jgi:xanthine dehydrogenase iron-sulfur cluster and FAD-binding subunit A